MTHRRRPSTTAVAGALALGALLLAGCGGSDDGSADRTPVEEAQADVDRAQEDRDEAATAFDESSDAFCGDAEDLITVVDEYGRALHADQVTVGEVRSGADDITSAREDAGGSANDAVEDHGALVEAEADLAEAQAELAAAKDAEAGQSTTTSAPSSTTTAPPLVPKETTDRVAAAEQVLETTAKSIDDDTPVVDAGIRLSSAAFAVEVAWLRLFADAGCLAGDQQAQAIEAVVAYTTALQQDLTTAGYYDGEIDGVYGPSTVAAVEALQKAAQLPVTGLVDAATEQALDAAVAETAGAAAAGATTRTAAVQGALKALGYWDGPTDGEPSPALADAVAQLQTDLGLEPTGTIDPATLDAVAAAVEGAKESSTTTTDPASATTTTTG